MKLHLIFICLFSFFFIHSSSAQEMKKKRGTVKMRDTEGRIYAKGKVRNYKRHGEWRTFNTSGKLVEIQTWQNGIKQGRYILYYPSGAVQDSGGYENDLKHGRWITRNANGSCAMEKEYNLGKINGVYRGYYPDGKIREVSVFSNDVVLSSRKWKADGRLDAVEYYCAGLACGKWTEYPEDCIQKEGDTTHMITREYSEGKLTGFVTETRNGVVVSKAEYVDDMLNGVFQRWSLQGVIRFEGNYINGQPHGAQKEYKTGKLISSSVYQRGRKQGRSCEYDLVGRVVLDRWYTNDVLDSAAVYHSNGKRSGFAKYSLIEGMQAIETHGQHFEYDADGKILLTGNSVEHRKNGVWTSFYPNGKVNSTTTYVNGIPQGLYTRYYTNGKKMVQYNILPSGLNTPPDVWDDKGRKLSFGDVKYQELYESSRPIESFNNGKPEELGKTREENMRTVRRTDELEVDSVYTTTEVMPEFPGGDEAMLKFISDHIVYPQSAKEQGVQGTVYVKFIVEKDGKVNEVSPRDGNFISFDLIMEGIRVVRMFPAFTPGMNNGEQVRVQMVIPVKFVLQ